MPIDPHQFLGIEEIVSPNQIYRPKNDAEAVLSNILPPERLSNTHINGLRAQAPFQYPYIEGKFYTLEEGMIEGSKYGLQDPLLAALQHNFGDGELSKPRVMVPGKYGRYDYDSKGPIIHVTLLTPLEKRKLEEKLREMGYTGEIDIWPDNRNLRLRTRRVKI